MPKHTQRGSLARALLKGISEMGAVIASVQNPFFISKMLRDITRERANEHWRQVQKSLHDLKRRNLVTLAWKSDGKLEVKITGKGKNVVRTIDIDELAIPKPPQWDKRWRVVIFDIPNTESKSRLALTQKLKHLGFKMIQKSVWVHPYPCAEEIMILRKFYRIEPYVTYLETAHVEDENVWREKFDLPLV